MNKRKYKKHRKNLEKFFKKTDLLPTKKTVIAPSGKHSLDILAYKTKEGCWNYTRGIVRELPDGPVVADIKRNYSSFWHTWVSHQNGKEYLLCGEDYQGYTVINLTDRKEHTVFPDDGYEGHGWCWITAYPSPDGKLVAVFGCYWACPYDLRVYDFSEPDKTPLKLLSERDIQGNDSVIGWKDDKTIHIRREIDLRKSDGKEIDKLKLDELNEFLKKCEDGEDDITERFEDIFWNWKEETANTNKGISS